MPPGLGDHPPGKWPLTCGNRVQGDEDPGTGLTCGNPGFWPIVPAVPDLSGTGHWMLDLEEVGTVDLAMDAAHLRELTRVDWVVSRSWNRLHHVDLTDDQLIELEDETFVEGPLRLACGRLAASVSIPGPFTRMGADRCIGCCRATGLPQGVGSPKNDPACRQILGLDVVTGSSPVG
jgi:hypothetical protein